MTAAKLAEAKEWFTRYAKRDQAQEYAEELISALKERDEKLEAAQKRIAELEAELKRISDDREYLSRANVANEWEERFQSQNRLVEMRGETIAERDATIEKMRAALESAQVVLPQSGDGVNYGNVLYMPTFDLVGKKIRDALQLRVGPRP